MCTVTYIPTNGGFILTSSRDEKTIRPTIKPEFYQIENQTWIFPKDKIAGGTWIATSPNKARCLLNGAFQNHLPNTQRFEKSRGQIVLESMAFTDDNDFIQNVDLTQVEPFTLLLFDFNLTFSLLELKWDGQRKTLHRHNPNLASIWSSVTLYSQTDIQQREDWFKEFTTKKVQNHTDIFDFHLSNHTDDSQTNILMKRDNDLQTVSVSQVIYFNKSTHFKYYDILNNETLFKELKNEESFA